MEMVKIFKDFTMEYLDPIGTWIGFLLAIPVIWTWVILLGEKINT